MTTTTRPPLAMSAQEARNLVATLSARVAELEAERDKALRDKDCFQRTTRAHWEALCAMRNSINEYVEMPNTDSGPLFSPEDGPIYADIAERVVAAIRTDKARAERAEAALATAMDDALRVVRRFTDKITAEDIEEALAQQEGAKG